MRARVAWAIAAAALAAACQPWGDEDLTALDGPPAWAHVAAGLSRTCGIGADGRTWCWGATVLGTLNPTGICPGPASIDPNYVPPDIECVTRPVAVSGSHRFVNVAADAYAVLAVDDQGRVWGWGYNFYGVLGHFAEDSIVDYPRVVAGTEAWHFKTVAMSEGTACGLTDTQSIVCWGDRNLVSSGVPGTCGSSNGACGVAAAEITKGPTPGAGWAEVVVGDEHACARDAGGAVYCWGNGAKGQLGSSPLASCPGGPFGGAVACRTTPTRVAGTALFTSLAAAGISTCGITTSQGVLCWGGGVINAAAPSPPVAGVGWTAVAIGGYQLQGPTACAIRNGTMWCFGPSQLGGANHQIPLPGTPVGVTVGGGHACAWDGTGTAWCVGDGSYGSLGDGKVYGGYKATAVEVSNPYKY